jgi:hypothetical protein
MQLKEEMSRVRLVAPFLFPYDPALALLFA